MDESVDGIRMVSSFSQPANACTPTVVSPSAVTTFSKEAFIKNA